MAHLLWHYMESPDLSAEHSSASTVQQQTASPNAPRCSPGPQNGGSPRHGA
jgi:hypothetical protein